MPLVIDGTVYTDIQSALDLVFNKEVFKESSAKLREQPVQEVHQKGLLYVSQREFAVVSPTDEYIDVVGTEDATTCHIVAMRHTGSGVAALAHCDGCDTESALAEMMNTITAMSKDGSAGQLEVHVAGGFIDDRKESIKLSTSILDILMASSEDVHLRTACVTDLNDRLNDGVHFPVIYGLAVNVKTGDMFPATFPDQGPELDVRSASHFVGCSQMLNIYESGTGVLRVGPFDWKPWDDAEKWCSLPDSFIRKYLSTSPAQEPEHFVSHVRAALKVIMQHPQPRYTLFPNGHPHRYHIQPDGCWKLEQTG